MGPRERLGPVGTLGLTVLRARLGHEGPQGETDLQVHLDL